MLADVTSGAVRLGLREAASSQVSPPSVFSVLISSLYKDTSHIELEPAR